MSDEFKDGVHVSDRDLVRHIELDRPRSKNGLTQESNLRLIAGFRETADNPDIRAIVLSGRGGAFCSGLDLSAVQPGGSVSPDALARNLDEYFHELIRAIVDTPVPTIAAIDGIAVGFGADLSLACDIRIMSERARFGELFVRRGLIPDGGSTFHLPRLIGMGRALELMYTGDVIDAPTALAYGICNHVYPTDQIGARAVELAQRIANGPPRAIRLIKQIMRASQTGGLEHALARERAGQLTCLQSKDFVEGITSFLQKRQPSFTGE